MTAFPIWSAVATSYRHTFANLGLLVRVSWQWFVLISAAVLTLAALSIEGEVGQTLVDLAASALFTVASCAVAVTWHRIALIGLRPRRRITIVFGLRELKYFLLSLAIVLAAFAVALTLILTLVQMVGPGFYPRTTVAVILLGLLLIITRISLRITAVTIDDRTMGFARSWRLTRGNTWRLTFGFIACTAPFFGVKYLVDQTAARLGESGMAAAGTGVGLAGGALMFLGIAVGAAFFSQAYRALVPAAQKAAAGALGTAVSR